MTSPLRHEAEFEAILEAYEPSESVKELVRATPILLLVGISGAGKDSINQRLLATGEFHNFVSYTTRAPRRNNGVLEQDGSDYHFVSQEKMEDLLRDGEMIEAKLYSGNIYGTGVKDLREAAAAQKIAVNDVEVQGVAEYKEIAPTVHAVFILPPSYEVWRQRFAARYSGGEIDEDDWQKRLITARTELQTALSAGYYDFVINDDLDVAVQEVVACAKGQHSPAQQQHGKSLAENLIQQLD